MKITLRAIIAVLWSAGCVLGGIALTHPGTPARAAAVTQCDTGVSPACAGWQDTNTTSTVYQDLELLDHNGAPIWWCNNAGGCWTGNDKLGVTGASVFDEVIYMVSPDGVHGALVIDGKMLTARDIRMLHRMEAEYVRLP